MFLTLGMKSFLTSIGTGSSTELFKMFLLYMNQSTQNVLIFSSIYAYSICYIAQRYIFCGGRFFGLSLLKYLSVSLVTIQLSYMLLNTLENIPIIKKYTDDNTISDTRKKIYQYLIINASIFIIFFCIELPLNKSFIFIKNKSIDYKYSYMIIGIGILIYIINNNITSINVDVTTNSTVSSIPNVTNTISKTISKIL
jgi:hypothetical protein